MRGQSNNFIYQSQNLCTVIRPTLPAFSFNGAYYWQTAMKQADIRPEPRAIFSFLGVIDQLCLLSTTNHKLSPDIMMPYL